MLQLGPIPKPILFKMADARREDTSYNKGNESFAIPLLIERGPRALSLKLLHNL